jgi:hypothetical protein
MRVPLTARMEFVVRRPLVTMKLSSLARHAAVPDRKGSLNDRVSVRRGASFWSERPVSMRRKDSSQNASTRAGSQVVAVKYTGETHHGVRIAIRRTPRLADAQS